MEFTALHYASFEGNRELITLLISWGADPSIKGKNGISVMHVAAQNNQAYSLTYFKTFHGLSICEKDAEQATPLHWACYHGADIVMFYLLAWIIKGKQQDIINAQ